MWKNKQQICCNKSVNTTLSIKGLTLLKIDSFVKLFLNLSRVTFMSYINYISTVASEHTVTQSNSYLNDQQSNRKLMQVGTFQKLSWVNWQKLSVNSTRVVYKHSCQLVNAKIHIILNNPNFNSQFIPSLFSFLPAEKELAFSLPHVSG